LNTSDLPIEVKTVDGFQGREKDIIIFSTVRSSFTAPNEINKSKSIGFLKDARRMNVSLSRCRQSLIVVCDINKLKHNKLWKSLVEYSFSLGTCYKVDPRKPAAEWFQEFDANPIGYKLKEYREKARPKPMQQEPAENIVS
jgi:senataxin